MSEKDRKGEQRERNIGEGKGKERREKEKKLEKRRGRNCFRKKQVIHRERRCTGDPTFTTSVNERSCSSMHQKKKNTEQGQATNERCSRTVASCSRNHTAIPVLSETSRCQRTC